MGYTRTGNFRIGTYRSRENRFVVNLSHNGEMVRCHLPNPGRMVLLLKENVTDLIFIPVEPGSNRKTQGTVIGVKEGEKVINLDTMMFQPLLINAIQENSLDLFQEWSILSSETSIGKHRFDFVLDIAGNEVITEVKSTTRVVDNVACFPDAVSDRATSHIRTLHDLTKKGNHTMVLFTVYRHATSFRPCTSIDPTFAEAFYEVLPEIECIALQIEGRWIDAGQITFEITGTIPVE